MRHAGTCGAIVLGVLMAAGSASAQQRQQIQIVGSSTLYPFTTTVAERFARTTDFAAPVVESTGTGGGIKLFCQGVGLNTPDIVNASRMIKDSEVAQCRENGVDQITEVKIGYDGIVLAAAEQAEPMSLTLEQLFLATAKQVPQDGELVANPYETWSDIDPSLPDTEIRIYGPPPTSGTRDAFVELVMHEGCEGFEVIEALPEDRKEEVCSQIREDGRYIQAGEADNLIVQKLAADPGARGILGFSFLDQNEDILQGATIEGAAPEFDAIAAGDYPVARPLFLYVKAGHAGTVPGIREFLAEFTSPGAAGPEGYLSDAGLIPLPEDEAQRVRRQATELVPMEQARKEAEEAAVPEDADEPDTAE